MLSTVMPQFFGAAHEKPGTYSIQAPKFPFIWKDPATPRLNWVKSSVDLDPIRVITYPKIGRYAARFFWAKKAPGDEDVNYVIFSPFLSDEAEGHYQTNPKALLESFEKLGQKVEVWSQTSGGVQETKQVIPPSLGSQRSSLSVFEYFRMRKRILSLSGVRLIVQEGNLAIGLVLASLTYGHRDAKVLLNIFDFDRFSRVQAVSYTHLTLPTIYSV